MTRTYSDEELIQRAIDNGWEQLVEVTDRFPGSKAYPWTGWLHGGVGSPVSPGKELTEWIGEWPNREKVAFIDSWVRMLRGTFDHEDRCQECDKFIEYGRFIGMERERAPLAHCWDCKFWLPRIAALHDGKHFVAEGSDGKPYWYSLGSKKTPSSHNGFAGRWHTVTFTDGRVVETCDLWFGGDVPERFQDRLPVTAELRGGRM